MLYVTAGILVLALFVVRGVWVALIRQASKALEHHFEHHT
jgi:hypothetical protein